MVLSLFPLVVLIPKLYGIIPVSFSICIELLHARLLCLRGH